MFEDMFYPNFIIKLKPVVKGLIYKYLYFRWLLFGKKFIRSEIVRVNN